MTRIFLFLLTNAAVLVVAGVVLNIIGINSILNQSGTSLNLNSLLIFCAVFGFSGAFISLFMSKFLAKRGTGARVIDGSEGSREAWLVKSVERLADKAGIGHPEVAIFETNQPNAFATGWNKNKALVAISSGMLHSFPDDEIEAVLGHEVGHVANGDMITLTLIQGVVNTFVMFLARIVGFAVDRLIFKNERGVGMGYFIATIVAEIALSILASTIVMWFSRRREFRADEAGARLASKQGMIKSLERLAHMSGQPSTLPEEMVAFGISGEGKKSFANLFRSHPPLNKRIEALKQLHV